MVRSIVIMKWIGTFAFVFLMLSSGCVSQGDFDDDMNDRVSRTIEGLWVYTSFPEAGPDGEVQQIYDRWDMTACDLSVEERVYSDSGRRYLSVVEYQVERSPPKIVFADEGVEGQSYSFEGFSEYGLLLTWIDSTQYISVIDLNHGDPLVVLRLSEGRAYIATPDEFIAVISTSSNEGSRPKE